MFVGIDQSYSGFGITFLWNDGQHQTLVNKFDPKKYGTGVDRLNAIAQWLEVEIGQRHDSEYIEHICMEGYANGAKFGREQAGELGGRVKQVLRAVVPGMPGYPTIVKPTSLKLYVTGRGGAKKNEILLHTFRKWGAEFADDNAADSYGLARMARDLFNGSCELSYETDALKPLRKHTELPV